MSVGHLREFVLQSGNWTGYVERVEMYFLVNKVSDELKLPTLISLMGEETYDLLSTLASPKKPSELTYVDAVKLLTAHLQPKPSELAERYKFRQRRQLDSETITDYVTELKKMSRFCGFGTNLQDNLRDQLVCGLRSEIIRQRLFAEENLVYNRAVALALSLEAAERDAIAVERASDGAAEGLHKLNLGVCLKCGDGRHTAADCQYKDYECSLCHEIGHLRRMCPLRDTRGLEYNRARRLETAATAGNYYEYRGWRGGRFGGRGGGGRGSWRRAARGRRGGARGGRDRAPLFLLDEQDDDGIVEYQVTEEDDDEEEPMYQMSLSQYKPVCITVKVHNRSLRMEVDTGTALSCISKQVYDDLFNDLYLKPCSLSLKFYDGSIIKPIGYLETAVNYKGHTKTLDLYVIDNGTTNLLGRQWLAELNIPVHVSTTTTQQQQAHSHHFADDGSDKNKIINEIISRHESLFDGTLGKYTGGTAELSVREGAEPIFCRARPLPYALRERVDAELDAMLAAGVIAPVDRSDWATPLVVVRKADGGLRLCADYKVTLNRVLEVDRFPVPKMDDLFSNLSGNIFFTKLDLSQAYNQVMLSDRSMKYTVINTHRGLFKYCRLVYGLSSSPGIFQKIMANLFKDMPDVVVFYDDVLIKSKDWNSHVKSIEKVLHILQKNGLKIKESKCEFLAREVKYLGFIIDKNGVRTDPDKVKAIATMPHPNNVTELKSFLGMVNFYGKFIKNLSPLLAPLYDLLKKGKHWTWGSVHNTVFRQVKECLSSTRALAHFDMGAETVVTVDASAHGIGAVLAQRARTGGDERVVAYASRSLTTHEHHYSQIHKEALAIIYAVDKFHQYLYGRTFVLRTDHKPLVSIFGPNIGVPSAAASRLQRWAIKLAAYDFNIEYVSTDKNTADVLSRLIRSQKNEVAAEEQILPEQTYLHFSTDALLIDHGVLKKETRCDPILSRVLSYIRDGWPTDVELKELQPYANRKKELYCELGCIMWGHRVVIPSSCRQKVLSELHDPHMGIVKTKSLARSYVWWPGIDEAVEAACRACAVCAAVADAPPAHAPRSWPWPSRPWSRLHLDFLGPIYGITFLIVVDSCSKWIEAIRMNRTTASALIARLRNLCAKFGLPKQIVSDNGPPFSSAEFKNFLNHNGVEHIFTAPYHPASNGAAENAVKICKRAIKKAYKQNLDIDTALCRFLLAYRNTEHATTGDSPANILQGRNLRMRLDNLKPERESLVGARQARVEQAAGGAERQLAAGTPVWYRDYRGQDKWVPGTIIRKIGSTDYCIGSSSGTEIHRHVDQLKLRVTNDKVVAGKVQTKHSLDNPILMEAFTKNARKSLSFPMTSGEGAARGADISGECSRRSESPAKSPAESVAAATSGSPAASQGSSCEPNVSPRESCIGKPCIKKIINSNSEATLECKKLVRQRKPPARYGFEEID